MQGTGHPNPAVVKNWLVFELFLRHFKLSCEQKNSTDTCPHVMRCVDLPQLDFLQ